MKTGSNSNKKYIISVACILILISLIKVASYYPDWIEHFYSRGFYLYISSFFRLILGWIPFSLGDILYAAVAVFLLISLFRFVKILRRRNKQRLNYKKTILHFFIALSVIYIYFNLFWGLNYNRPGIAYQLNLDTSIHKEDDLKKVTGLLLKKVNETKRAQAISRVTTSNYTHLFIQAQVAYQTCALTFPFLQYNTLSVKKSMYGRMGNFLGFLGYYNPFTGEAQVNLTQPKFLIPFVTCHEMAHQLGYASESEANFVGYLAAIHSPDTAFHYSAYFDLFNYANRELFFSDSIGAKNNYKQLDTLVKRDEEELRKYWQKSDNLIEPIISIFYDRYLKANQQKKGVKSYNEVVGWLIAYYNKYGKI